MAHEHLDQSTLDKLLAGQLSDQQTEVLLIDIADCDECTAKVDESWMASPVGTLMSRSIELDPQQAKQMENQLLRRINRSNFGNSVVSFGLGGFVNVLMAFLRPILSFNSQSSSGRGNPQDD